MVTVQIRLTGKQLEKVSKMILDGVYPSKSELCRSAVNKMLEDYFRRQ